MISIELEIPSLQIAVQHGLGDAGSLEAKLIKLERYDESGQRAQWNNEVIQTRQKERHDLRAWPVTFKHGDVIMLINNWLIKQHGQKFYPKWLGLYVIHQAYDNGMSVLSYLDN